MLGSSEVCQKGRKEQVCLSSYEVWAKRREGGLCLNFDGLHIAVRLCLIYGLFSMAHIYSSGLGHLGQMTDTATKVKAGACMFAKSPVKKFMDFIRSRPIDSHFVNSDHGWWSPFMGGAWPRDAWNQIVRAELQGPCL